MIEPVNEVRANKRGAHRAHLLYRARSHAFHKISHLASDNSTFLEPEASSLLLPPSSADADNFTYDNNSNWVDIRGAS